MATVQGTPGADTLVGSDTDDTFLGGAGADQMTGGDGNDIYYVDSADDTVNEVSGSIRADGYWQGGGTDTVHTNLAEYTLPANVENLQMGGKQGVEPGTGDMFAGKAGVRHGVGNRENNLMQGDGGSEHFEGLDGSDTLLGGGGSDTLDGGLGGDLLDGGAGADVMLGGAGSDTYMVDDAGDVITDVSGVPDYYPYGTGGIDVMKTSLATVNMAAYKDIEEVQLIGDPTMDRVVRGSSQFAQVTALDGNDLIEGMGGNDTLYGGGGNDTLAGFAVGTAPGWKQPDDLGVAKLYGGAGDDLYVLTNGGSADTDAVYEYAGQGRDTVVANSLFYGVNELYQQVNDIEVIRFSGQQAWGNALDNLLVGEGHGFQHLRAGGGNDTIQANAAGAFMDGGAGNDWLQSASVTARDLYQWGAGSDVIQDAGGVDSLRVLGAGQAGVTFGRQGNDLQIDRWSADRCTIKDWFDGTLQHRIEFIVLDDGLSVSATDIDDRLAGNTGTPVQLPELQWVRGRDMSAARSMTDSWGDEAIKDIAPRASSYSLEWGRYINLYAASDEPRMLRGSSANDVLTNLYNHVPEIWAGEGDDDITLWQSSDPKPLRVHGGEGNDTITANTIMAPLEVDLAKGSGRDVVTVRANVAVSVVLSGGLTMADVAVRSLGKSGTTGLYGQEIYVKSSGDAVQFWSTSASYDTPSFFVTDGKTTQGLSQLAQQQPVVTTGSATQTTQAQGLVDGMAVFSGGTAPATQVYSPKPFGAAKLAASPMST